MMNRYTLARFEGQAVQCTDRLCRVSAARAEKTLPLLIAPAPCRQNATGQERWRIDEPFAAAAGLYFDATSENGTEAGSLRSHDRYASAKSSRMGHVVVRKVHVNAWLDQHGLDRTMVSDR